MNGTRAHISPDAAALAAKVTEFWSNVTVGASDECWPWIGYIEDGYGRFFFAGSMRGAHELAVTFTTGERRASNLDTCHSCNNPPCCNPAHLRFDTRKSNVQDMITAGTHRAGPSKLDHDKVHVIRERYAAGASQLALANDYGVTNGLISQIVKGNRWASAPGPIQIDRRYNRGQ